MKIRAFKAIDDLDSCRRFALGHEEVLASIGIEKVTSSDHGWFHNPEVYVIILEQDGKVFGGARIHVTNGEYELPLEEAVGRLDPNIYGIIRSEGNFRSGEICGLWSANEFAGKGLSILLARASLAKAGVSLANQLKIKTLYSLMAPWTLRTATKMGFEILRTVGDNGSFSYPRPDLKATVVVLHDTDSLVKARDDERNVINDLRNRPVQERQEQIFLGKDVYDVSYELFIDGLDLNNKNI
ncbi:MAG: hypothetical protein ABFR62_00950 [Bacteroidota bacterium]